MSCTDVASVATAAPILLLIISEALPLIRRVTGIRITPTGILDLFFVLAVCAFSSGCIDDSYIGRVERLLGRDVNGDGVVGSPTHSSHSAAPSLAREASDGATQAPSSAAISSAAAADAASTSANS